MSAESRDNGTVRGDDIVYDATLTSQLPLADQFIGRLQNIGFTAARTNITPVDDGCRIDNVRPIS